MIRVIGGPKGLMIRQGSKTRQRRVGRNNVLPKMIFLLGGLWELSLSLSLSVSLSLSLSPSYKFSRPDLSSVFEDHFRIFSYAFKKSKNVFLENT